jgi:hypothetical protein
MRISLFPNRPTRSAALLATMALMLTGITTIQASAATKAPAGIDVSAPGISTCVTIKTGAMRYVPSGVCKPKVEMKVSWTNFSFAGNPASPKLVGCYQNKTGAMRLLLKGSCAKGKETKLGWANFRTKGVALAAATKSFLTVSTVLYACANLKNGSLRLITKGKCTIKKEKAIHWSNIPPVGDNAFLSVDNFESLKITDPLPDLGDSFLVIGDLYMGWQEVDQDRQTQRSARQHEEERPRQNS